MPAYISEIDYDGGAASNFVEIVVHSTIDASGYTLVAYNKDGTIIQTYSLGAPVNTVAGKNTYLLDDNTPNWIDIHKDEALALVDDTGSVVQFISFKNPVTAVEGPANGTNSTVIGQHSGSNRLLVTSDGGGSYSQTTTSMPGVIPSYAPGTEIATPSGPRAVETLRPGDLVDTLDGEPAEILWISSREIALDEQEGDSIPVLIRAGAFGPGKPLRDLIVSPQHRLLLGGRGAEVPGIDAETLVPAKALVVLPGVRRLLGERGITRRHHFVCRGHHIVEAEGCWSESLLLSPMVLNWLPNLEQKRLRLMFGQKSGSDPLNGPPARPILPSAQAERLLRNALRSSGRSRKSHLVNAL